MSKLKKIYHIADIHIRNLKRHQEYREVFDRLFNDIKLSMNQLFEEQNDNIQSLKSEMLKAIKSLSTDQQMVLKLFYVEHL